MNEPKFFWLKSDGKTIEEISSDEWRRIAIHQRDMWSNARMILRIHDSEIYMVKGRQSFWIPRKQLEEALRRCKH